MGVLPVVAAVVVDMAVVVVDMAAVAVAVAVATAAAAVDMAVVVVDMAVVAVADTAAAVVARMVSDAQEPVVGRIGVMELAITATAAAEKAGAMTTDAVGVAVVLPPGEEMTTPDMAAQRAD